MNINNQEVAARKTSKQAMSKNGHAKRVLISAEDVRGLQNEWRNNPRWRGVTRNYSAEKVLSLRGTMKIEYTIADRMSRKLWHLLNSEAYVNALGALTGNQAVQM